MKIWLLITDDDKGIQARVFASEAKACAAGAAWFDDQSHGMDLCLIDRPADADRWEFGENAAWIAHDDLNEAGFIDVLRRSARAQIDDLLHQIYQMQDMFDDSDGEIARAIAEAEAWTGQSQSAA